MLLRRAVGGVRSRAVCRGVPPSTQRPARLRLPLRIPRKPAGILEGAPHVPMYRIAGAFGTDYDVDIRIDIPHPNRQRLQAAQRVLDGLRLPDWPNHC
jgi:hypothetical protein